MTLGVAEDAVRSPDLVKAKADMSLLRLAGFRAVRVTSVWQGGQREPAATELAMLKNAAAAANLSGIRLYVAIHNAGSKTTPLAPESRAQFVAYATAIAKALPTVRDVIVGREPNSDRYWLPQFRGDGSNAAAPAYLALLAETYDALKALSPELRVYGGALAPRGGDRPVSGRGTHSPTAFIRDVGAAYRASKRTKPVMDAFVLHPYGESSSESPDVLHPLGTTIGVSDYGKLVALLGAAFDGTAQPGSKLPILYDELGIESVVPATKSKLYTGAEPPLTRPVDERTQAAFYRRALEIAFCQPNVAGMLFLHARDEPARTGWQSGVYYADGSQKTSLEPVRVALGASRGGSIASCPGLALDVKPKTVAFGLTARALSVRLRCELDCAYRARLVKLPGGSTTSSTGGRSPAGVLTRVVLPNRRVAAGRYRIAVTINHPVNPGVPVMRESAAFSLR